MLLLKKDTGQSSFYISRCRYCGGLFIKFHNRTVYCSKQCKHYALCEQKAEYERKRRRLIREGELVRKEVYLGTGNLKETPLNDFNEEFLRVRRELERIGV